MNKKHQNTASFQITSVFIESFKSVKSKMKTNIESVNRFNLFHNQIQWVHQKMWLEWVQGALLKWDSIGRWQKKTESIQRYKWKTESHDTIELQHKNKIQNEKSELENPFENTASLVLSVFFLLVFFWGWALSRV